MNKNDSRSGDADGGGSVERKLGLGTAPILNHRLRRTKEAMTAKHVHEGLRKKRFLTMTLGVSDTGDRKGKKQQGAAGGAIR